MTDPRDVPTIAYHVQRADGSSLLSRDADTVFYAASTVKLAVLAAVARAVDDGSLNLDDTVASRRTFTSDVAGAPDFEIDPDDRDEGMPPEGTPMAIAEVIERMIVVSSNEATNIASDLVGLGAVARVLADAGATASSYGCKYSDFAASGAGATRNTTPRDLARLMSAIVSGALASPRSTEWMTALLARQQDRLLTATFADDTPFGSKSGSVTRIRHDVAYRGAPGPTATVIAVCTGGYDSQAAADEAIRAIGQVVAATLGA